MAVAISDLDIGLLDQTGCSALGEATVAIGGGCGVLGLKDIGKVEVCLCNTRIGIGRQY